MDHLCVKYFHPKIIALNIVTAKKKKSHDAKCALGFALWAFEFFSHWILWTGRPTIGDLNFLSLRFSASVHGGFKHPIFFFWWCQEVLLWECSIPQSRPTFSLALLYDYGKVIIAWICFSENIIIIRWWLFKPTHNNEPSWSINEIKSINKCFLLCRCICFLYEAQVTYFTVSFFAGIYQLMNFEVWDWLDLTIR